MTDVEKRPTEQQPIITPVAPATHRAPEPTGWVGWVVFAGVMLMMVGTFQVIAGLAALFQKDYYVVTQTNNLLVHVDYTGWGWIHLALGGLAILAGLSVLTGHLWARVFAIIAAFGGALANIAFLNASPVWCTIMIAVDVLVIYAVAVHGREVKQSF